MVKNNLVPDVNVYGVKNFDYLISSLSKLLWKLVANGRVVVVTKSDDMSIVSQYLWKYNTPDRVLPNSIKGGVFPELQLIYITDELSNPNRADFLIVINRSDEFDYSAFKKVFYIFDLHEISFDQFKGSGQKWELGSDGRWIVA